MAHTPENVLKEELDKAKEVVSIGASYYHYKNPSHFYRVLAIGLMEEDERPAVVYQAEYGEGITFIRPLESWLQSVDDNGETVSRFSRAS